MLKDTIYTIPINDVFNPKCGCPICLMRDMLEKRCIEYIMGAAMMEPDIRIETNKNGFCPTHFDMMSQQKNRLSLALMLETHLDEIQQKHMPISPKKSENSVTKTCYVCKEIAEAMGKMVDTALKLCLANDSFKETFFSQPFYCFPHYELLCQKAFSALNKKQAVLLVDELTKKQREHMNKLRDDVHRFSTMFDYRNANAAEKDESIKTSIERTISFLNGRQKNS